MSEHIPAEVKLIAWDLDGTIIDSPRIFRILVDELAEKFDLVKPNEELFRKNFHGTLPVTLGNMLQVSDETLIDELVQSFVDSQEAHYHNIDSHLLLDAIELGEKLEQQGKKQIIVTNREHHGRGAASPRELAKQKPLEGYINAVISGDDFIEFRKPDPRIMDQVLHDLAVRPEEVLVIGDQFVDAQLAINLGAKAIIVLRGSDELVNSHELPDGWQEHVSVVKSLHEVTVQ